MAVDPKYIVFKSEDVQKLLTEQWRKALVEVQKAIANAKSTTETQEQFLFVLDLREKASLAALEVYIRELQGDSQAQGHTPSQDRLDAALSMKYEATMNITEFGLPK